MPRILPEQYHLVDGEVEDIKELHPLENLREKTIFIERFQKLFGNDMQWEDISDGQGFLFKITYQGYEYNIFIEAFDGGGGKDKKKKIAIPGMGINPSPKAKYYRLKQLIKNYDSVLIINEYVPLIRMADGTLGLSDKSIYGIISPSEIYSSGVIKNDTGHASSRWVSFDDMKKALNNQQVVMNNKKNVYVIPSEKIKDFFDTKLIIEQYEEMSKYLYNELKKEGNDKNKEKLENSITRLFRNNLIRERIKLIDETHSVKCTCEFCDCNVNIPELLVASHINAKSNIRNDSSLSEDEKYTMMTDVNNGFLLCRTHDALFDKKFITISEDGKLILSERIKSLLKEFNIEDLEGKVIIKNISEKSKEYLKQHRADFNKKNSRDK